MVIERFGKSSEHLLSIKQDYFTENDALLERAAQLAELYTRQPRRERCKNCARPLQGTRFVKHGVPYVVCQIDGHLNGIFEDSDEFARVVYTEEGGGAYADVYREADRAGYQRRVETIYQPKVDFLLEVMTAVGEDPQGLRYGELGAGSGYLIAAFEQRGITHARGYEVSEVQVGLANDMLGRDAVTLHELQEVTNLAKNLEVDVLAMMGTLEHLRHPRDVLQMIASNEQVRYIYLQLPIFSISVLLEAASQDVWPRQLSGAHTHLYTERSIDHFCREFGFKRIAEWWFGTDIMDLYRQVFVHLSAAPDTSNLVELWSESFAPTIDLLQLELDKRRLSSQVHLVLEKI